MKWSTAMDSLAVILTSIAAGSLAHIWGGELDHCLLYGSGAGILTISWFYVTETKKGRR